MSVFTRATVEYVRTGQQRAFGDSINDCILTIEMASPYRADGEFVPTAVGEAQAKRIAQGLIGWVDNPTDAFQTRLDSFEVLGEGRYRVVTRARFND